MESVPRPFVSVHGEDVDVEVPGQLTIRATYLSEGLFDERAGGDPEEQDLYEVEVTHADDALPTPVQFPRLMPASGPRWDAPDDGSDALPMERFLLALAWELAHAHPSNWERVCQAARGWDSWSIDDAISRLPLEWTPEPLVPDED